MASLSIEKQRLVKLILKRLIFISLILFLEPGYSLEHNAEDTLRQAYQHLWYAHYALNYPASQEILEDCIHNQIKPCLQMYHKVKDAKHVIVGQIETHRQDTFQFTVDTLLEDCVQPERQRTCLGAIIALYFFDETQEDNQLREILLEVKPEILEHLFSKRFEWFFNRPHPDKWIRFIQADKLNSKKYNYLIDYFKQSKQKAFGVMLQTH